MDLQHAILAFAGNQKRIAALVQGLPEEQVRWKPAGRWSVLEVVNHLWDEERYDFRVRLDILLNRPGDTWPPIDPEGWVAERRYNERDLAESLAGFQSERTRSLAWLKEIEDPDWERAYDHPRAGTLRAGDLLASWLAHDALHMRQLVQLHFLYGEHKSGGYSTAYAGTW